jgi:GMP synthase (glutamine-hydrolysing)
MIERIKAEVGKNEVICGVSGGVDSTVLAVLLAEAGVKVRCIYIDTGLMRLNETAEVKALFGEVGVPIEQIDASAIFLGALKGVTDPEQKRRIIGTLFIDEFWKVADNVELLAQGTLYPDVIESATSGSIASKIKTHHNRVDRIMELKEQGKVLEPLAELFKDEVRALGASARHPHDILWRHPVPRPRPRRAHARVRSRPSASHHPARPTPSSSANSAAAAGMSRRLAGLRRASSR